MECVNCVDTALTQSMHSKKIAMSSRSFGTTLKDLPKARLYKPGFTIIDFSFLICTVPGGPPFFFQTNLQ